MQEHGSLVNLIMSQSKSPEPTVGMGMTFCHWSDRSPGTVVEILGPNKIVVQADKYTRTDNNGMSECQRYIFEPDPTAPKRIVTRRRDGQWRLVGTKKGTGPSIMLGKRDCYYDYSF